MHTRSEMSDYLRLVINTLHKVHLGKVYQKRNCFYNPHLTRYTLRGGYTHTHTYIYIYIYDMLPW